MKTIFKTLFTAAAVVVLGVVLQACATGTLLAVKSTDPTGIKGSYTLILYGCRYADDVENIAILVDEQNGYPFEVYAPDFMYKVQTGLSAQEALKKATTFIQCGMYTVSQTAVRRISDDTGKFLGYEVKPLYRHQELGASEVLNSWYIEKDGKVRAYLSLDPKVNELLNDGREKRSDFFK